MIDKPSRPGVAHNRVGAPAQVRQARNRQNWLRTNSPMLRTRSSKNRRGQQNKTDRVLERDDVGRISGFVEE